jgi:hypothetical protein
MAKASAAVPMEMCDKTRRNGNETRPKIENPPFCIVHAIAIFSNKSNF